ncbi:hypothetical protein FGG08_004824 [Glutinoglossum americanum]|uniref:Uncharacterized protein n=1 Tax=Glutinoglossum americanum TaxID=1670608 RepID=A0A9P8HVR7_9PEZI|nr:hypothetical protein FGG08_004824 [Glutinoglossum americanum]
MSTQQARVGGCLTTIPGIMLTCTPERFRTLSNSYYRGAHGVILVYDISNRDSFLAMDYWFREAETNAMPGVVTYLVGSKLDKTTSRSVKFEEGEALAQRHGSSFCEVSAKTRENVRRPFIELVNQIVNSPQLMNASKRTERGTISMGEDPGSFRAPCSC